MNNNILFTTIMVLFAACIYVFQTDMIEGYLLKGSRVVDAYPTSENDDQNFDETVQEIEPPTPRITYNYNLNSQYMNISNTSQNNTSQPQNQFNSISNYSQSTQHNYNTRTPQDLPEHNLMETYIPRREDYNNNNENNVSGITPNGFRNGARPVSGAALLRGEVNINNRENFVVKQTPIQNHRQTTIRTPIQSSMITPMRTPIQKQKYNQGELQDSIRHASPILAHIKK